jgi:hypothetical protein
VNEILFTSSVVFKSSSGAEISNTRSGLRPIRLDRSCHAAIFSNNLQLESNRVPRGATAVGHSLLSRCAGESLIENNGARCYHPT